MSHRALHFTFAILVSTLLAACATSPKEPPPTISLDEPVQVLPAPEPLKPMEVVAVPEPLPLPAQLKPLEAPVEPVRETTDPQQRVAAANEAARVPPNGDGYINAVQVWPFTDGALYQVYASPGRVTDIMLQPGEDLVSVSAGDTVRWIVGDTTSASGAAQRVHVLVKPIRPKLKTNLVITTNRRSYLLELMATDETWMASVSWSYPADQLVSLRRQAARADAAQSVAQGIPLEQLRFRYAITGDSPPWRPLRAFDDGEHVYIQFPTGIAQGELPPVFVVGVASDAELVNYRYRAPYYIVDRLFGAAELRLGGDKAQSVRVTRTDVVAQGGGRP
jgi:type IV secretion system protein VirB9